jgi:hypothetical protein
MREEDQARHQGGHRRVMRAAGVRECTRRAACSSPAPPHHEASRAGAIAIDDADDGWRTNLSRAGDADDVVYVVDNLG